MLHLTKFSHGECENVCVNSILRGYHPPARSPLQVVESKVMLGFVAVDRNASTVPQIYIQFRANKY